MRRTSIHSKHHRRRLLHIETLELRHLLALTVNTSLDELDLTNTDLSLREAMREALETSGETINFAPSLDGATILLDFSLGDLDIDQTVTIDASMLPNGLTIEAYDPTPTTNDGRGMRILDIVGGHVTLKSLILQGGDVKGSGGWLVPCAERPTMSPVD
jgi:hypothetical protein